MDRSHPLALHLVVIIPHRRPKRWLLPYGPLKRIKRAWNHRTIAGPNADR